MFNVIINSEQYDEFMAQKEKIKELEARLDSLYKDYQQTLSDKAALIKARNELENKVIRFKELVTEKYRLKMPINDLMANNKELKAKIKESVGTITINPCRDSDEAYSPDSNTIINIKNLCFNNYISEEDENNGGK